MKINNNKFLFSMAAADFLAGTFGITGGGLLYLVMKDYVAMQTWILFGILPLFLSFFMSILSLCILTVDRLIAVTYALRYHSIMTEFRANALICSIWVIAIMILLIHTGIYLGISKAFELKVRAIKLTGFYLLGTVILCFANMLHFIIRNKQRRVNSFEMDTKTSKTLTDSNSSRLYRTTINPSNSHICILMTAAFVICWSPITALYNLLYLDPPLQCFIFVMCLAATNSVLNPIIYFKKRKEFRARFRQLFKRASTTQEPL